MQDILNPTRFNTEWHLQGKHETKLHETTLCHN